MNSIEVRGLFGDRDVKFRFDKPLLILIGENGVGKSTILGIINSILTKNLESLREYDFDSIKFEISQEVFNLHKDDLDPLWNEWEYSEEAKKKIFKDRIRLREMAREMAREIEIPVLRLEKMLLEGDLDIIFRKRELLRNKGVDTHLLDKFHSEVQNEHPMMKEFINPISEYFSGEVLYFPTYRRVEEEAYKIGRFLDLDFGRNVIKFGMQDVQSIFDNITDLIREETINGVQNVMDGLFTELVSKENLDTGYSAQDLKQKREDLEIILQRSEKSLPFSLEATLEKIDVILDKENVTDKDSFIMYFISKYLTIYETSKVHDEKINQFIKVCNSYFKDKEFKYDLKKIQINLLSKHNSSKVIELKGLSSGEKQIVSLFANLYLSGKEKYTILFDEPELSLSIKWQEKLLKDILETKKCDFMIAVTHSPFIVPEELKEYALSFGSTIQRKELSQGG